MTQTAQIRLTASRGSESRHLWIYGGQLGPVVGEPIAGGLIDVLTPDGRFYGRGLYSPASKIRVRLLTFQDEPIDEAFWLERIQQAIHLRQRAVAQSNAYRLIYGEGDRLPGLIVDRYDQLLVMQTLSVGMDCRKELLADVLMKELNGVGIYLRNDAKSRQLEGLPLEGGFLRGSGPTQVEIQEGAAKFLVDVERGQKTGWFCDQRENRLAAAKFAAGAEVLEVFCHTGAFGIHAALAGAVSVESLDVSQDTLTIARQHAMMNRAENRCTYRQADAFEEMRHLVKAGRHYDLVILDPPAFARSKQAVPGALAGYKDINLLGLKLLKPDGFLVTCSCSHPVTEADLWNSIRLAARDARRDIRLIEQRGQSADHPILASMPETRYLKCFIVQAF
ncbi:MAG: class I SAM-dependent rRNA methyltransferase [Nitrospira sp. LK70]|nr:class I SAM-dependent rRNA methyltransferase [Nitrospira sp. LK70]